MFAPGKIPAKSTHEAALEINTQEMLDGLKSQKQLDKTTEKLPIGAETVLWVMIA